MAAPAATRTAFMPEPRGDPAPAALRLALLGSAALQRPGGAPLVLSRFDAALLALLALDGPTSRQRLLALLWPDQEPEAARNALRQRLFRLRRAAGVELVCGAEQLALAESVAHDLAAGDGELLAGHDYVDCPELHDWLDTQRRALQQRHRARDAERIAQCERDGQHAEGAALADALLAREPLHEGALRQLMKLRYLAGDGAAAIAAYDRFVAALAAEHPRARPARETAELLQTIRDAQAAPLPALRREIPASVLRPPRLVGRDAELAALRAAWSEQRAFWLLGEAGLGKSRLLAEFVAQAFGGTSPPGSLRSLPPAGEPPAWDGPAPASPPGSLRSLPPAGKPPAWDGPTPATAALVVAARPGDGGVPYASLGRALRALLERQPALLQQAERGELARVMPELAVATMAGAGAQMALQRAIVALLRGAQRHGVAALVFDDLHFADPASLEMLRALVCDDALATLHWGFAQRPAEGPSAIGTLREALEESQRVDVCTLSPLHEAQMRELIDSLGVPALDAASLAPQLARHTGGNPLYALETIKHLIVGGAGSALPRPASVGQLIERRLRQLSAKALALARVAAVAGVDFSIELAAAVLDAKALALADAWRELEAAQVLRGNAFAHDLVHEATLASVPAPIAAHTHGEVAAFLEGHGGEPARVAAHWIAAGQSPRALAALHAAAETARHAMRRREEAAFLQRAAQIERDTGERDAAFASWRAAIDALSVADLGALDESLFGQLDEAAVAPQQRAVALAMRAHWRGECGDLAQARQLSQRAIELADAAGDEATAVDARQRLAQFLDWEGECDTALALLQPLLPWAAERAGDLERTEFYCRLAIVLDNTDRSAEARVYHQHAIAAARKAQAWHGVVTVLGNLAISWATTGHMARAIELLREAMQLAAAHDEARGCAASLPAEMYKCLRDLGHYAEAQRWIEPALAAEPGLAAALLQCHVACGWMHLGQHARAQREIDAALAANLPGWMRAKALQMKARLQLALGQRGAAGLLNEALALVRAQPGRRALAASIALDHALTLDPAAALAGAREVVAQAERLALPGTALAGHIRAARFAADAHDAAAAAVHAHAALAIDADVSPNDLYPAERWLQAWRALTLAGVRAEADEALRRGAAWVQQTRREHVSEPFRDSFVRANAVNAQLLRAAASR